MEEFVRREDVVCCERQPRQPSTYASCKLSTETETGQHALFDATSHLMETGQHALFDATSHLTETGQHALFDATSHLIFPAYVP